MEIIIELFIRYPLNKHYCHKTNIYDSAGLDINISVLSTFPWHHIKCIWVCSQPATWWCLHMIWQETPWSSNSSLRGKWVHSRVAWRLYIIMKLAQAAEWYFLINLIVIHIWMRTYQNMIFSFCNYFDSIRNATWWFRQRFAEIWNI